MRTPNPTHIRLSAIFLLIWTAARAVSADDSLDAFSNFNAASKGNPVSEAVFRAQTKAIEERLANEKVSKSEQWEQKLAMKIIRRTIQKCLANCHFVGDSREGLPVTDSQVDGFASAVRAQYSEFREISADPIHADAIREKYLPDISEGLKQAEDGNDVFGKSAVIEFHSFFERMEEGPPDRQGQKGEGKETADLNRKASDQLEAGDYDGAVESAGKVLESDPNNVDALNLRANALYRLQDYSGANEDAKAVLAADPHNSVATAMLELTREHVGDVAVGGRPGADGSEPSSGFPRVSALASSGGSNMTPAEVLESSRLAQRAASKLSLGDDASALDLAKRAVEANGQNARAYMLMAAANIRMGRYEDALAATQSAEALIGRTSSVLNARAFALNRMGRYAAAKAAAEEALAQNPEDAEAWYNLANAQAGLNDRQAMLSALNHAAKDNQSRYGALLQSALEAPEDSDLTSLFPNAPASVLPQHGHKKSNRGIGFYLLLLAAVAGGALIAFGVAHALLSDRDRSEGGEGRGSSGRSANPAALDAAAGRVESIGSGTYEIRRQIGAGGMGTVYEAMDLSLQRQVAIKKMRDEIRSDERERDRFLKEARLVAALHHPNIVDIYSIVEDDGGEVYLIFEYVEGRTLDAILRSQGRIPLEELKTLFKGVCSALDFAHKRGIIHRDLKPSNIMVAKDGTVKVMDFGVARQAKDALTNMAMTNTVCGTPSYMAPEAEQGIVRKESDVYSLGVCFYELLAGSMPFPGIGAGLLLNKMNLSYVPPSRLVPGLPSGVDDLLNGALQPDPDRRLKSPREFLEAMDRIPIHRP